MRGAKGNRTPDLLDANETRYQLRYSPVRLPNRAVTLYQAGPSDSESVA